MGNRTRGTLPRGAAADLWRHTLSQIPSVFGRLVYLAALRDADTGRYEHHGLALVYSPKEADLALRDSHVGAFQEWLTFNLEQQRADLELYLSALIEDKKKVIENWLQTAPYRMLIPSGSRLAERSAYISDLEIILELLKNEHGVSLPDPDA